MDSRAQLEDMMCHAATPADCTTGRFVESGLRAARHSRREARPAILADIAAVLDCSPDALAFLFADEPLPANDGVAVPDFRSRLRRVDAVLVAE